MIQFSRDALITQLRAHRPAGPAEAEAVVETLDLLETHPEPFARGSFTPGHVTASALLLSPDGTHVALIQHPKLGLTLQPGGHVEARDGSALAAALRELEEETGVRPDEIDLLASIPVDVDVHDIPPHGPEPRHRHFDLRFGFQLGAHRDLPGVQWTRPDDIHEASLRRAARKLLRLHRQPDVQTQPVLASA